MSKLRDLTGQTFGRLTAIRPDGQNKHRQTFWICKCSCGKEVRVIGYNLTQGTTRSCGCLVKDNPTHMKHNGKKEYPRLYRIWKGMKCRCYSPKGQNNSYYGGRGITICPEWEKDFTSFRDWALNNGYSEELTLDRIDVNGNYCPENCRWASLEQQSRNKRDTVLLELNGEVRPLIEWSEIYNINYHTLYNRVTNQGMSLEEAISKPRRKHHVLSFNGETHTLAEWSKITGISYDALAGRLKKGKSPEEILTKKD